MTTAIELSDVTVVKSGVRLLHGINWRVLDGQRWIVLGPNGAGKTTLMQIVAATAFPTTGTASILGEQLGAVDVFDLRTRIGLTSTSIADQLPRSESVRDVVLSAAHAVTGRWREEYDQLDHDRAQQIMGEMGISSLADRTFGTLSEGERKRALISRALMTDPEVLVLDEPAAGLDLGAREDLISSLQVLAQDPEAPVQILVTHHVEEIPAGFTHVLMLRDGAVVAAGALELTLTPQNLQRCFSTPVTLTYSEGRYAARRAHYGRRAARGEG